MIAPLLLNIMRALLRVFATRTESKELECSVVCSEIRLIFSFLRRCKSPPSLPYNGLVRATIAIAVLCHTITAGVSATDSALVVVIGQYISVTAGRKASDSSRPCVLRRGRGSAELFCLGEWTMAERTMVTVMAELVLGCDQGTGPEEKVEVLAAVGKDQAQNFIG